MIAAVSVETTELADDALYEVVNGVVIEKPTSALSIWIAGALTCSLGPFVRSHRLGTLVNEMLFILNPKTDLRRRPDIAFISAGKWPIGRPPTATGDWDIIPDLAVEVASPGNTFSDLVGKVREYFRRGVGEVWILVPEERQVYVYHTPRNVRILQVADTLSTPLIPEWSAVVGEVIPEMPADASNTAV